VWCAPRVSACAADDIAGSRDFIAPRHSAGGSPSMDLSVGNRALPNQTRVNRFATSAQSRQSRISPDLRLLESRAPGRSLARSSLPARVLLKCQRDIRRRRAAIIMPTGRSAMVGAVKRPAARNGHAHCPWPIHRDSFLPVPHCARNARYPPPGSTRDEGPTPRADKPRPSPVSQILFGEDRAKRSRALRA